MWECGPTVPSGVRPLQNSEPLLEPLQVIEAIAPTSSNRRWWFLTFSVHLPVLNLWSFLFSVFFCCCLFVCLFVFSSLVAHLAKKKKSTCSAQDLVWISGSGRSPGEENGNPLQYSCLENSMDRGGLQSQEWETVGHDWVTNTFTFFHFFLFWLFSCFHWTLSLSTHPTSPLPSSSLLFPLLSWTLHKSQSSNKEAQPLTKRQDQVCCWRWGVDFLLSWFSVAFYQPVLYHPLLFCLHATYLWNFQNKSLILKCTSYIFKDDQRQKSKRKFPFVS